jgi:hypothetical protein
MQLTDITTLIESGVEPELELHAVDPMIYQLFNRVGEALVPVRGPAGSAVRFTSRHAALSALRETGLSRVAFVHRSAYGEMIGVTGSSADTELRELIRLREA